MRIDMHYCWRATAELQARKLKLNMRYVCTCVEQGPGNVRMFLCQASALKVFGPSGCACHAASCWLLVPLAFNIITLLEPGHEDYLRLKPRVKTS